MYCQSYGDYVDSLLNSFDWGLHWVSGGYAQHRKQGITVIGWFMLPAKNCYILLQIIQQIMGVYSKRYSSDICLLLYFN